MASRTMTTEQTAAIAINDAFFAKLGFLCFSTMISFKNGKVGLERNDRSETTPPHTLVKPNRELSKNLFIQPKDAV